MPLPFGPRQDGQSVAARRAVLRFGCVSAAIAKWQQAEMKVLATPIESTFKIRRFMRLNVLFRKLTTTGRWRPKFPYFTFRERNREQE